MLLPFRIGYPVAPWIFVLVLVAHTVFFAHTLNASTMTAPEVASTDDITPVLIDVTANDYNSEGKPLVVTVNSNTCPGDVSILFDGTALFVPTSAVNGTLTCTIEFDVSGARSTTTLTISHNPGGIGGACGGDWGPSVLQPSGTDFLYGGAPVFLAGYYPGLHSLGRVEHDSQGSQNTDYHMEFFDTLAERNINLIRVALTTYRATGNHGGVIAPYVQVPNTTAVPPHDNGVGWGATQKFDLDHFNDAFFEHWSEVLSYAESKGVMVIVSFFEARGTWNWQNTFPPQPGQLIASGQYYDFLNGPNNVNGISVVVDGNPNALYASSVARERHATYVRETVRRLGGHKNVIWEIANEPPDFSAVPAWMDAMCVAIRDGEFLGNHQRHAVMPVDLPEHRDVDGHGTPGNDENFTGVHNNLVADVLNGNGQPQISDNDCCADPGTRLARRKKAWATVTAGAHPLLFHYRADERYEPLVTSASTREAIAWVGNTRKLIVDRDIDFMAMGPRDDLVSSANDTVWLRVSVGNEYIAYFLNGGTATFDDLPSSFEAEWFDPRTGAFTVANANSSNGNSATFSTPTNSEDWVLYIASDGEPVLEQGPFGGTPWVIGSSDTMIAAIDFDEVTEQLSGDVALGQGVAYNDLSEGNGLGSVRSDQWVDATSAAPGFVGAIENGEWLEYTVDVPADGDYALHMYYATRLGESTGSMTLTAFGANGTVAQGVTVPDSNDGGPSQRWVHHVHTGTLDLTRGAAVLRLTFDQGTFDLGQFQLVQVDTAQAPYGGTAHVLPGTLEAELYDTGALHGYFDDTPFNIGADNGIPYRVDEWVDVAVGLGTNHVIAWFNPGEWLEYTVSLTTADTYPIRVTYSTLDNSPGRARLTPYVGGTAQAGLTFDLPPNGTGEHYDTLEVGTLALPAGVQELRFEVLDGNFAFDRLDVGNPTPPEPPVTAPDRIFFAPGQTLVFPASDLTGNDEPLGEVEIIPSNPFKREPIRGDLSFDAAEQTLTYVAESDETSNLSFEYYVRNTRDGSLTDHGWVDLILVGSEPVANHDPEGALAYQVPPGGTLRLTQMELMANDTGHLIEWGGLKHPIPDGLQVAPNSVLLEYTAGSVQTTVSFEYRVKDYYDVYSDWATVSIQITGSATLPVGNEDDFFMAHKKNDGTPADLDISLGEVIGNDFLVPGGGIAFVVEDVDPDVGSFDGIHAGGWKYIADATALEAIFKYRLGQGNLHASEFTDVRIHAIPAPVGGQDTFTVGHDTVLEMDLQNEILANDNGFGADISATILTQPAHGSLDLLTPGVVKYTADPGFADDGPAVDTFTYAVVNQLDGIETNWATRSAPVTVSITVQSPDAFAADDVVHVATGVQVLEVPLATLFRNDSPADELVLVELGEASAGTVELLDDLVIYTPGPDFDTFGRDAFTYTVRRFGGNPNVTPTATVTVVSDGAYAVELHDTFEGPDLSAWDTVYVGQGNAALQSVQSAYTGYQGVELHLKTQNSVYLRSGALLGATHGAIAMDIDPSRLTMADGNNFNMLAFSVGTMKLRYKNGTYQVQLYPSLDGGASAVSGWVDLKPEYQNLRVEWRAASAPGLTDGFVTLWLDGALVAENANLKNGTRYTSNVLLGAAWGMQATTSGRLFLDNVRLSRGPLDQTRHAWDDFESGTFDAWTGVASGGGIVGLGSDVDGQWMEITPDGSNLYTGVYENFVAAETHYGARFHLDLHTLAIPDSQSFFLLNGTGGGTLPANLRLRNVGGQWQVAAMGIHDGGTWATTGWHDLPGSAHHLGIEWWSASGPAANDGGLRLMIDDQPIGETLGIDNDTRFLKQVVFGSSGADPGTTGTFLLDDFRSWRGTRNRTAIVADDFDDGLDSVWNVFGVGAVTTVQSVPAFGGSQAATFQVSPGAAIAALQHQGESLASFAATFDLHLGSLSLPDKAAPDMMIFTGSRPGVYAFSLRVRKYQGQHELRLVTYDDAGPVVSSRLPIDPASVQSIGLSWWRSSGVDTGDGGIRLVIDDGVVFEVTDLDNDTQHFDRVRLGAVASIDATTSGTFHIDNFQSWQ